MTDVDSFGSAREAARQAGDQTHLVEVTLPGASWAELTDANPVYRQSDQSTARVVYDVPLTVGGATVADIAAGEHDAAWSAFGRELAESRRTNVIRLRTPAVDSELSTNPTAAAFRRAAQMVRAHNELIRIEWVAPIGTSPRQGGTGWPGAEAVDFIGLDIPASGNWTRLLTQEGGVLDWADWAATSGKKVALRWQIGPDTDAAWVRNMNALIQVLVAQRRMGYESMVQIGTPDRAALAAYRALW
ncbi:MAG: hypothetical protein IPL37_00070 [Austwickia sp.]|nr:hypothetical protein [Austwickia sp.]